MVGATRERVNRALAELTHLLDAHGIEPDSLRFCLPREVLETSVGHDQADVGPDVVTLLCAAVGFLQLQSAPPEVAPLRQWRDTCRRASLCR